MVKDGGQCLELNKRVRRLVKGFEDLPDELLAEILYRRRCSKSIIQCKCVCRRWCDLISQVDFLREWDKRNVRPRYHLLFRMIPNRMADGEAGIYRMNFLFSLEKQTSSLVLDDRDGTSGKVVGACHDLVLCCRDNKEGRYFDFFIINIQTKQRMQLPSPSFYYTGSVGFRFMCDPLGNPMTWRYSVVVFNTSDHCNTTEFPVHFLLSTNGNKWCDKLLSLPEPCSLCPIYRVQAFQGKHLLGAYSGVIYVDPYPDEINNVIECPLVAWPPHFKHGPHFVGVCNGNLLFSFINYNDTRLWVWLLKDYKTSEWHALHSIAIQDLVYVDPRLKDRCFNKYMSIGCVLGFDPTNSDLFYTLNARDIILWDLHHKTMQLISPIDVPRPEHEFGGFWTFSMSLPTSPTPLPTLL